MLNDQVQAVPAEECLFRTTSSHSLFGKREPVPQTPNTTKLLETGDIPFADEKEVPTPPKTPV